MRLIKNPGRRAGLLYLLTLAAPLRLVYIPAKLFVAGDAAATANNIATHETLFRLGMLAELFTGFAALSHKQRAPFGLRSSYLSISRSESVLGLNNFLTVRSAVAQEALS